MRGSPSKQGLVRTIPTGTGLFAISINNFNFNEKSLIYFKKFNEKDKIALVFYKSELNWDLKKLEDQFNIFWMKTGTKRVIKPNIY